MDFHLPAIVKLLIIFGLVLTAIRRKFTLGSAFLAGALLLGLLFGLPPGTIVTKAGQALMHPKTLSLTAIVALILVLSTSMEQSGHMARLLARFQGLVQRAGLNLIVFPALIGLLPMPGGAIFSAPMVKHLGEKHALSGAQLSYVNYWYRHVWEYWWPLYPGVLLTTTIARIDLWLFVLLLCPLTVVALLAGFWPLKGAIDSALPKDTHHTPPRKQLKLFVKELTPVLIVILVGLGLGVLLSLMHTPSEVDISKESGLIIALLIAIGWVWHQNKIDRSQRWAILGRREMLRMVYMVAAILVFQGLLQGSRAVDEVSQELIRWHIPLSTITVVLPFFVGGIVGITIAFVGTTFPILISLVQAMGQSHLMLPYMMLALASGFMGVLFSPLHLCLLLSNQYFNASLTSVYRYLWIPCTTLLSLSWAYFWLLIHLMPG